MENSNNILLKSISELLSYKFFIPSYQRGYRWTAQQVTDLLNDINEFSPKQIADSNDKTWYCLQPIVVKQKDENEWDVIDGQQRLTTIFLVIHYINEMWKGKQKIKEFNLRFETRDKSQEFLKNILVDDNTDEVIINNENIDFNFISKAYSTIHHWVKSNPDLDTGSFESKFIHSSKVIWYEASKDTDSIDIFTRINSGKIPLTNAELIKALFLNRSNFANADEADEVKLGLIQREIASEWDRMEYALQDDSFWYFINKSENNLATRIEFIFNLMYEVAKEQIQERQKLHLAIEEKFGKDEYSTFRFFSEKFKTKSENEINDNWQEIKKYFQTLEEWFNDKELYHKIGYLITTGIDIKNIIKEKDGKPKIEFKGWLNDEIKKTVNVNIDELEYGNGNVRNILLLHNIQTMLNNENETNRFPFDRYKKEFWDVEHISAQAEEIPQKEQHQIDWLDENSKFIPDSETELKRKAAIYNKDEFEDTFNAIVNYFNESADNVNDISNLTLLDAKTNRSYKNAVFPIKRKTIIEREKSGTFIPICTKNVFMKFYSQDVAQMTFWGNQDRTSYLADIKEILKQYLPQLKSAENEQ